MSRTMQDLSRNEYNDLQNKINTAKDRGFSSIAIENDLNNPDRLLNTLDSFIQTNEVIESYENVPSEREE